MGHIHTPKGHIHPRDTHTPKGHTYTQGIHIHPRAIGGGIWDGVSLVNNKRKKKKEEKMFLGGMGRKEP